MFLYSEIAREWDNLNALSAEEVQELDSSIEDGVFQAFSQFTFQLLKDLQGNFPEIRELPPGDIEKIERAISNSLLSGYLVYVAYQKTAGIERQKKKKGIPYNPDIMNMYNDVVAPIEENERNLAFNQLLDSQPALELLFERVSTIEMNVLRRIFPKFNNLPFKVGFLIKEYLGRGIFIGFGIGYCENILEK